jgi:hypothetical protein
MAALGALSPGTGRRYLNKEMASRQAGEKEVSRAAADEAWR